jgi:alpha-glucan,water dikinase
VHAGADLEKCVEVCRNFLEGHVVVLLQNILNQRGASDGRALAVIDSITEVRQLLGSRLIKEGDITKLRDLLYLDLGLEAQMRLMAERAVSAMDKVEIKTRTRALALWVSFALENLVYNSAPGVGAIQCQRETRDADELKAVLRDWAQLVEGAHKGYGGDWPTQAMSVVERMRRAMGHVVDVMQNNMQAKAEYLGYGLCSVTPEKIPEKWSITLFSEELVRGGGCSFVLSSFLRKLDKSIRAEGGGTLWQIISQGDPGAKGWLVQVPDLMSVQAETYDQPTILLAHSLSGEEEVPPGVVGVITPDAPDVLAHISVRARNLKVLFATCFDSDEFDGLARFVKKKVECKIQGNRVTVQEMSGDLSGKADMDGAAKKVSQIKIDLPPPTKFSKYALAESAVDPDAKPKIHGAKTANIVLSRRTLPEWIQTPRSAVIPFGVFEKVMSHPDNKHIAAEYKRLSEKELHASASPLKVLEDLKGLIKQLNAPIEMVNTVKQALVDSEIIEQGQLDGAEWDAAFMALKGVWASKWNDRAYYSCKKAGIGVEFVQMAVLVQRLVEAEYAFVIHTVNPSSNDSSYMYAEVVVGLGETLVGNFPGRALGFQMKKDGSSPPEIQSLPSKSTGLFGGGLIFRSDSNGEDLPGFAGAGLYDSIPMVTNTEQTILYHNEKLTTDKVFADDLMRGICKVAVDVEHAYGGAPQDIEGCYKDGKFYVVQTRPQV